MIHHKGTKLTKITKKKIQTEEKSGFTFIFFPFFSSL
jgi:hypothetical protein